LREWRLGPSGHRHHDGTEAGHEHRRPSQAHSPQGTPPPPGRIDKHWPGIHGRSLVMQNLAEAGLFCFELLIGDRHR
jgi:hypothetical protein